MATQRKKRLQNGNTNNRGSLSIMRAQRAERNKVLMIIMTGLNFTMGHLPILITYLPIGSDVSPSWICFTEIGN